MTAIAVTSGVSSLAGPAGGARDAHQPASLRDGEPAGPAITDVGAFLGDGPLRRAPFRNSNSKACLPTRRSSAAIRASYAWIRSAVSASSSNSPTSYLATHTRIRLRQTSCRRLAKPWSVSPGNCCALLGPRPTQVLRRPRVFERQNKASPSGCNGHIKLSRFTPAQGFMWLLPRGARHGQH
jgi:hypothetical protein